MIKYIVAPTIKLGDYWARKLNLNLREIKIVAYEPQVRGIDFTKENTLILSEEYGISKSVFSDNVLEIVERRIQINNRAEQLYTVRNENMKIVVNPLLFEAIMNTELLEEDSQWHEDKLYFYNDSGQKEYITINDFYFKCIEWLKEQDFDVESLSLGKSSAFGLSDKKVRVQLCSAMPYFYADTIQEALIISCQWLFENKDK